MKKKKRNCNLCTSFLHNAFLLLSCRTFIYLLLFLGIKSFPEVIKMLMRLFVNTYLNVSHRHVTNKQLFKVLVEESSNGLKKGTYSIALSCLMLSIG